jgi:hypothetical protein
MLHGKRANSWSPTLIPRHPLAGVGESGPPPPRRTTLNVYLRSRVRGCEPTAPRDRMRSEVAVLARAAQDPGGTQAVIRRLAVPRTATVDPPAGRTWRSKRTEDRRSPLTSQPPQGQKGALGRGRIFRCLTGMAGRWPVLRAHPWVLELLPAALPGRVRGPLPPAVREPLPGCVRAGVPAHLRGLRYWRASSDHYLHACLTVFPVVLCP